MNQGTIQKRIRDGIATIEFYHPQGNSFPTSQLIALESVLKSLSNSDAVRVIVLQSDNQGAFCGGASFEELLAIRTEEQGKEFFKGFASVINAMRKCSKPIIGRIHGKAVGGGVGLAAACDYCMSTEAASIRLSELSVGIGPFVIAPAIMRKMGQAALSELSLSPTEWHTAYWAQRNGLFAKVFETKAELDTEVHILATKLTKYNSTALCELKKIFWEGTEDWDELLDERAAISGKLVMSEETKKALSNYKK